MNQQPVKGISFGFLDYVKPIEFDGGRIEPVSNFQLAKDYIDRLKSKDGFVYPPCQYKVDEQGDIIPQSVRPALLWRPTTSHALYLDKKL